MAQRKNVRVGRPAGSRGEDTIARIRASALRLFARNGYEATSLKIVAKDIGVTPATIYQYFDSKKTLYISLFDEIYQELVPQYHQAAGAESHIREQITALLRTSLASYESHPEMTYFLAGAMIDVGRSSELQETFAQRSGTLNELVLDLFEKAKHRGELPDQVDSESIASTFFGAFLGMLLRYESRKKGSMKETVEVFITLMEGRLFR
ncbi:TetR/AcrR family transcriptional regulator [Parahaliea mediterranea]|uniref:TetR/AcrR family transcriptional regulator n=1 Tax=Parahaliea mediterranea TaxID=651086 RepID=A0A939DF21_9GAMM|nr:TetR/AcrR family transcriptional regulator [Parahaliea mediterranea]MBN7796933.1 TetR/AcrR family transcriptional regulator [Parahaliea mediterranea]